MGVFATTNVLRKVICNLKTHGELNKTELSRLCSSKSINDAICFLIWIGKIEKIRGKSVKREINFFRLKQNKIKYFEYENNN